MVACLVSFSFSLQLLRTAFGLGRLLSLPQASILCNPTYCSRRKSILCIHTIYIDISTYHTIYSSLYYIYTYMCIYNRYTYLIIYI